MNEGFFFFFFALMIVNVLEEGNDQLIPSDLFVALLMRTSSSFSGEFCSILEMSGYMWWHLEPMPVTQAYENERGMT